MSALPVTRTVLHGVDQSVPDFARMPNSGHMASRVYQEDMKNDWIGDTNAGAWLPNGIFTCLYDFERHGGDQGAIRIGQLPGSEILLDISVADLTAGKLAVHLLTVRGLGGRMLIMAGWTDVIEELTSEGSAQIAIRVQTGRPATYATLLAAESIATAGAEGVHNLVPNWVSTYVVEVPESEAEAEATAPDPSPSPSESLSESPSLDESPSPSPSESLSESPSPSLSAPD